MTAWRRAGAALAVALACVAPAGGQPDVVSIPPFSSAMPGSALPDGWRALAFAAIARRTSYTLVRDPDAGVVVRAEADASASALYARLDLDPAAWRRLAWRWKVEQSVRGSDATRRSGDDFAVRVYVAFRHAPERLSAFERVRDEVVRLLYGEYPPHAALNYVWDSRAPVGTTAPSPSTPRVKLIVVESGAASVGRWLAYQRDVFADYRAAFGEEPPPLAGVGIMTDADDTGERAVAYYGDLKLAKATPGPAGR